MKSDERVYMYQLVCLCLHWSHSRQLNTRLFLSVSACLFPSTSLCLFSVFNPPSITDQLTDIKRMESLVCVCECVWMCVCPHKTSYLRAQGLTLYNVSFVNDWPRLTKYWMTFRSEFYLNLRNLLKMLLLFCYFLVCYCCSFYYSYY